VSENLQNLQKFIDEMREKKAEFIEADEAYLELEKSNMPFVFNHQFKLQEGSAKVTFIVDGAAKLVSAYYGSSFNESMNMEEYLRLVGLLPEATE